MSLAVVFSRAQVGVQAPQVTVEVHLANGLPRFNIVGLAETAVKESKDRVRGALLTSRFEFPARRITVNLAPADLPKEGGRFDLPIAIGILAASRQIPTEPLQGLEFLGELALTGGLRPVRGVLTAALACQRVRRGLVTANDNAREAGLIDGVQAFAAEHLLEVTAHLNGGEPLGEVSGKPHGVDAPLTDLDLEEVKGQALAKRALEVAAAGGHSLLMIGPPGTGKTMLASRLPGLLPELTDDEAIETAAIHSLVRHGLDVANWRQRPFRRPHHSASGVALVGGGSDPKPGEISLAHNGVLFLDELPEFERRVLELLREPLENGAIHIARAARRVEYPARFQLVAAMNPCPCGWLGDAGGRCHCTEEQVHKYRTKVSGPLLDRIDMHIEVPPVPRELLRRPGGGETSAAVRARVTAARARQLTRQGVLNHALKGAALERHGALHPASQALLDQAMDPVSCASRVLSPISPVQTSSNRRTSPRRCSCVAWTAACAVNRHLYIEKGERGISTLINVRINASKGY